MDKIMQCCYTNASDEVGGTVSSGWQSLAVSDNMPEAVLIACSDIQKKNSDIKHLMKDEDGQVLNLLEFVGDGSYIYTIRTDYNSEDSRGRFNMFSHAYAMSLKDTDVVKDPNTFLTIADENFVYTKEEAEQSKNNQDLKRLERFNLKEILERFNLSEEIYRKLIKAVYTQFTEKSISDPLYIVYSGDSTELRAILYAIYKGLPYFVRKKLSVASSATSNTGSKNLIFTKFKDDTKKNYIVVNTGENNILSDKIENKIARYGFLDFALDNPDEEVIEERYTELEKKAISLGEPNAADEIVLKIAYVIISDKKNGIDEESLSDDELILRLSDALRARSRKSGDMYGYIADKLNILVSRNRLLTEDMEQYIDQRFSGFTEDELRDENIYILMQAYIRYYASKYAGNKDESIADKFIKYRSDILYNYLADISTEPYIAEFMDACYMSKFKHYNISDNESLAAFIEEVKSFKSLDINMPGTEDLIRQRALSIYQNALSSTDARVAYETYMTILSKLGIEDSTGQFQMEAKSYYWEVQDIANYSELKFNEYDFFKIAATKSDKIISLFNLSNDKELIQKDDFKALYDYIKLYKIEEADIKTLLKRKLDISPESINEDEYELILAILNMEDSSNLGYVLDIRLAFLNGEYNKLEEIYDYILKEVHIDKDIKLINKIILNMLIEDEQNDEDIVIDLDLWLRISKIAHDDYFGIFNTFAGDKKPAILQYALDTQDSKKKNKEYDLEEGYRMMMLEEVREDAKAYVKNKGVESKFVKELLKNTEDMTKKKGLFGILDIFNKKNSEADEKKPAKPRSRAKR